MLGSRASTFLLVLAALSAGPIDAADCSKMVTVELPDVTIVKAEPVDQPVPHCRVEGRVGRQINFHLLLPEDWNGRFLMGGGGGFVGRVDNQAMSVRALQRGYATVGTDTGHQAQNPPGSWALHDLEAIVNYGHLAVHRVAEVSKALVAAHYGDKAERNYFFGCSNGGRQALIEAQRYPDDFDMIVSGAPALDFQGLSAAFTYTVQRMFPDPDQLETPVLSLEDRELLRQAILDRCDARDGVEDQILNDPDACDFDPAALACTSTQTEGCLTAPKLAAIEAIYGGPKTSSGESLHVGFPFGAEDVQGNGWGSWLVGGKNMGGPGVPSAAYGFGVGLMRYFIYQDPEWSYEGYGFDSYMSDSAAIAQILASDDPDLDAYRERGGKLLMFHGWSDSALSAHMSTEYVDAVLERDPSAGDDLRLFMMPGMLHCFGGRGPSMVDWVGALEKWDETKQPPSTLEASFPGGDGGRLLCAWPKTATFTGGDDRDPASYQCR